MLEIWKPVVGFEGLYWVSTLGRVKSVSSGRHRGKILAPLNTGDGRNRVVLFRDGVRYRKRVYRLVAEAFLGPSGGLNVLHGDDIKDNDRLSNLRYGTHLENAKDAAANGRTTRGLRNRHCKLDEMKVRGIRELLAQGVPQAKIAQVYGIGQMTVSHINLRRTWGWLD